ncbi:MAG: hypothetical protein ACI8P0_006300, partial [Planctomycetaceae bacterium]
YLTAAVGFACAVPNFRQTESSYVTVDKAEVSTSENVTVSHDHSGGVLQIVERVTCRQRKTVGLHGLPFSKNGTCE